jgi:hypothetical protein
MFKKYIKNNIKSIEIINRREEDLRYSIGREDNDTSEDYYISIEFINGDHDSIGDFDSKNKAQEYLKKVLI